MEKIIHEYALMIGMNSFERRVCDFRFACDRRLAGLVFIRTPLCVLHKNSAFSRELWFMCEASFLKKKEVKKKLCLLLNSEEKGSKE